MDASKAKKEASKYKALNSDAFTRHNRFPFRGFYMRFSTVLSSRNFVKSPLTVQTQSGGGSSNSIWFQMVKVIDIKRQMVIFTAKN